MDFELLIPFALFFMIGYIVKVVSEYRLRKNLVEKGIIDETIKHLYTKAEQPGILSSIKWGMILIAAGLGLLVFSTLREAGFGDEFAIAFMFIFAGIALLIYYFIAGRILKKSESSE